MTTVRFTRKSSYLDIGIEIPQIDPSHTVDGGEQCRVNWRPLHVVHVIAVVLERMQRPIFLHVPQLHRPIKRRREEVGRELDLPRHRVTIDAGHRSLVPFEHVGDAGLAAMATGSIDGAFFAADNEIVDVVREE